MEILGTIDCIHYTQGDFYIFSIATEDKSKQDAFDFSPTYKIRGNFHFPLSVGTKLKVTGTVKDTKYGPTVYLEKYETVAPDTKLGIIKYLSQLASIGEATAEKIYVRLGEKALEILDEDLSKIDELEFLTGKQAASVREDFLKDKKGREIAIFLFKLGLGPAMYKHIFGAYGCETIEIVEMNPYVLTDIHGFGFKRADEVALKLGIAPDSEFRFQAAIVHILKEEASNSGHLFLQVAELHKKLNQLISTIDIKKFGSLLKGLVEKKKLVVDGSRIYERWHHHTESRSAEYLAGFLKTPSKLSIDIQAFIAEHEKTFSITLEPEQREALESILNNRVMVLTGGPGTGKTTLVKAFVRLFDQLGLTVSLFTPTGISAKRLGEVTGRPAGTIHRQLGYTGTQWGYHNLNKFPTHVAIVDEVSMVDQTIFYHLLDALDPSTIVIFVGDADQLPSVGPGNVLKEMIGSKHIKTIFLNKIHRQEAQSRILANAHHIRQGEDIEFASKGEKTDFHFYSNSDENSILDNICLLSKKLQEKSANFQVLSPMHDGILGVKNLNVTLKELLNPKTTQREINLGLKSFREEDRIIITKNCYDHEVFNGDCGKVLKIDDEMIQLAVEGVIHPVLFKYDEARDFLSLAYAITIHKSQGMEYGHVIVPLTEAFYIMLQRNLIYTAVTRAKRGLFLFGTNSAVRRAINNNKIVSRNTSLGRRIVDFITPV